MQRVYIGGPMSGKEFYNVVEFMRAAEHWRDAGYDVTTPFDTNSIVWRKEYGRPFNPFTDKCEYGDPILPLMIAEDVKAIANSDILALLPGWTDSKGSLYELRTARLMGKPVFWANTRQEMSSYQVAVGMWL